MFASMLRERVRGATEVRPVAWPDAMSKGEEAVKLNVRMGTEFAGAFFTVEMEVLLLKKGVEPMKAWTGEEEMG